MNHQAQCVRNKRDPQYWTASKQAAFPRNIATVRPRKLRKLDFFHFVNYINVVSHNLGRYYTVFFSSLVKN